MTTAAQPPTWVPDASATACTTCKAPFTFLNRRHHCRRCGGLFCGDCCGLVASLPEQFGQKKRSRVCNKCFKLTIKERVTVQDFATLPDGGPSSETKVVSSMQKMLYWKMGAHEGGLFDRTVMDVGETSAGAIAVQQVQDLMTDTESNPVRLRVYTPAKKPKGSDKHAVLVWFHTGNFCTRSIESPSVDGLARLLANQIPCIVVSVDYRLAPDNAFPDPLDDCFAAVEWAIRNSKNMGSDPSLISVGGDGAGGNLAAAVALMARDKGLPNNVQLLTQLLVCPPLNLSDDPQGDIYASRVANKNAYMLPLSQFQWFAQQYAKSDKTNPYVSPILAANFSNLPPALVISAAHDLFWSEDQAYAKKLRSAGVRVIYSQFSNSTNSFFGSGLDESDEAVMELVLYLANEIQRKLRGPSSNSNSVSSSSASPSSSSSVSASKVASPPKVAAPSKPAASPSDTVSPSAAASAPAEEKENKKVAASAPVEEKENKKDKKKKNKKKEEKKQEVDEEDERDQQIENAVEKEVQQEQQEQKELAQQQEEANEKKEEKEEKAENQELFQGRLEGNEDDMF